MARVYSEAASRRQPAAAQRWTAAAAGWWQCGGGAGVGAGGGLGKGSGGAMARSGAARAGVGAAQCALGRRPAGVCACEEHDERDKVLSLRAGVKRELKFGWNKNNNKIGVKSAK